MDVVRAFSKLKCRLMPYLYQMAIEAHEHGTPMMRPMMMEFPEDPACEYLDRQYMLGDRLLVAPIFREDGKVTYYIPAGEWYNLLTGEKIAGGAWRTEKHGFLTMPLLVRGGTVLPMGSCDHKTDYAYTKDVELQVFGMGEGERFAFAIPTPDGKAETQYAVSMKNGNAIVETEAKDSYTIHVHS